MALLLAQKSSEKNTKNYDTNLSTQNQPKYVAFLHELPTLAQIGFPIAQNKTDVWWVVRPVQVQTLEEEVQIAQENDANQMILKEVCQWICEWWVGSAV